jgi:tetratricopeptide (TPR) repeat protein
MPALVADRFELLERVGAGAMGEVHRALDRATGHAVALKLLLRATEPGRAERFRREADALAALDHPGFVRLVARGEAPGGRPFLAMEWVEGETLAARLARGPIDVPDALALAGRLADALAAGLVHRDVKPSNVLLPEGELAAARLVDLGIAHLVYADQALTGPDALLGTLGYVAPEQARGQAVDGRADVFSLGCVLYEALVGARAFDGDEPVVLLLKAVLEDAPRVAASRPDVPAPVDALVARMLARSPGDRPTAASLASELAGLGGGHLASAPPAARPVVATAERRVVSVLVARPSAAAPVRWELVRAAAAQHGARLDRLEDGSLVALFAGADSATDLAARGARFALALREALPPSPVVLGTGTSDVGARWDVGALVARLGAELARASAGEVALDGVTPGLLGASFVVESTGSGPVLRGERRDDGAGRTLLGRPSPFVGREREIGLLSALFDECANEPAARVALVRGAPGVGKSRLREELVARVRARRPDATVLVGRADPLAAGASFALVGEAIRRAALVRDADPIEARRAALAARVARHVDPREAPRVARFVGEIVGAPFPDDDDPQLRAARRGAVLLGDHVRRAVLDLFAAEAAAAPLVIVLEDVQWADRPSLELASAALEALAARSLLVVAVARPEIDAASPGLFRDRGVVVVDVGDLGRRAGEELVVAALGEPARALAPRLVERADGNAFYLEELVRAVAEGRGGALPETVLAMVQARLEGLGAEARRVLRAASVFGGTFWRGGVAELVPDLAAAALDASLAELVARELVVPRREARFPGEREVAFRHALVREGAYGMLTDEDRAAGHARAGAFLERAGEPDARTLAEHFDRGGVRDRAARAYVAAAEQCLEGNDFAGAIAAAERAATLGAEGATRGEARRIAAEAHAWRGEHERAIAAAGEAMELLPRGGAGWLAAAARLARTSTGRRDPATLAPVVAALDLLGDASPRADRVVLAARLATACFIGGRRDDGRALVARAEALAAGGPVDAEALAWLSDARAWGHYGVDTAAHLAEAERAVACLDDAGDLRNACLLRIGLGSAAKDVGAHARAEHALREALRTAELLGLSTVRAGAEQNLGVVLWRKGARDEAIALERAAAEGFVREGDPRMEGGSRCYLALFLAETGALDAALAEANRAERLLADVPAIHPFAFGVLATVLLWRGEAQQALPFARAAMAALEAAGDIPEGGALVHFAHASALRAVGDPRADAALAAARDYVLARAALVSDPDLRRATLEGVPENARVVAVARARLRDVPSGY